MELKPCAHCGGTNLQVDIEDGDWYVQCVPSQESGCGATLGGFRKDEYAVTAWNTRASAWQDIATAPKDGTMILLGGKFHASQPNVGGDWHMLAASWSTMSSCGKGRYSWYSDLNDVIELYSVDWSHWMPLPLPPEAK